MPPMILQIAFFILIACATALQPSTSPIATYRGQGEYALAPSTYAQVSELLIQIKDGDNITRFVIETMTHTFVIKIGTSIEIRQSNTILYSSPITDHISRVRVTIYSAYSSDIADEGPGYFQIVALTLSVSLLSKALHANILSVLSLVVSGAYIYLYWGYEWLLASLIAWLGTFLFIRTFALMPSMVPSVAPVQILQ